MLQKAKQRIYPPRFINRLSTSMTLERKEDNNPIHFQEVDDQCFAERQTSIGNKSVAMKHFNYNPINQFLVDVLIDFQPSLATATLYQLALPKNSVQYHLLLPYTPSIQRIISGI
ncbi:hypothetical protein JYU19_00605 [bacterium AH-315-J21]|nr:hypothetical protein [bacterium AH-315-J21]